MNAVVEISRSKRPIYFSYLDPKGFSGQRAATELVIRGLAGRGWCCRRLPQPVLDRSDGAKGAGIAYCAAMLGAWLRSVRLIFARGSWFCSNLPQTRVGMLREAVNLLAAWVGVGRKRIVISLHGSLFMHWAAGSFEARLFKRVLALAGTVTVLGERQRERLLQMGVSPASVCVVVNSCDLAPLTPEAVARKVSQRGPEAVQVLYLSSLIDTKGYPEYLEALREYACGTGKRIEAVLCGKLFNAEQSERFSSSAEAESWIERMLAEINRSGRVSVRWVKGAVGEEKRGLFHEADVFVLPTRYAVEAQPLVLLEAMASGCAIVTTEIGEIPTILDGDCALLLKNASAAAVTTALNQLAGTGELRARLARNAHRRFLESYQVERHVDVWETILGCGPKETRGHVD